MATITISSDKINEMCGLANNIKQSAMDYKAGFCARHPYLKPECDKGGWEKLRDQCMKADGRCKVHWKKMTDAMLFFVKVTAAGMCFER